MNEDQVRALGFSPRLLAKAVSRLDSLVEQSRIPGYSLVLARSDQPAVYLNGGCRNLIKVDPFDQNTIVRLASLTKPMMSVLLLMLVEQGLCSVTDPVSRYLPAVKNMQVLKSGTASKPVFEPVSAVMTVHDLLSHRAGFGYDYNVPPRLRSYIEKANLFDWHAGTDSLAQKLIQIPLLFQPGQGFNYGLSTDLLGCVIERISQRPLDQVLASNICQPAGMTDTGFYLSADKQAAAAELYLLDRDYSLNPVQNDLDHKFNPDLKMFSAGGGLMSTASDYMKFVRLLINRGRISTDQQVMLSEQSIAQISMDYQNEVDRPWSMGRGVLYDTADYGFGYNVKVLLEPDTKSYPVSAGEYGWAGVGNSYFWVQPQIDLAVLLFSSWLPFGRISIDPEIKSLIYQAYMV